MMSLDGLKIASLLWTSHDPFKNVTCKDESFQGLVNDYYILSVKGYLALLLLDMLVASIQRADETIHRFLSYLPFH